MVHVQGETQVFLKSTTSKSLVLAPLYKTQCEFTQPQQLTCIILLMKQQQFFSVLPCSCFVSWRYDFSNINMNKQCPMSSAFIGPASLQIFDMTFDKRMAFWNDHRLLGAPVRQTLIKG